MPPIIIGQTAGKNVTLSDIHIANPTFTAPNVNTLTNLKFALIVDDDNFSSSPSYVDIEVNPSQQMSHHHPTLKQPIRCASTSKKEFYYALTNKPALKFSDYYER